MDQQKFAQLMIQLRKEKNLTQQDLASIFNVSFQAVSKWEKGNSIPDISTLEKISKFYNIPINYLINGEAEDKKPPISELIKERRFKLIWCSISLLVLIITLFFPIIQTTPMTFFFQFFAARELKEITFMFILAYLSLLASIVIGITSVFIYKNKTLVSFEEPLSFFSVLSIISFLIIISSFIPNFNFMLLIAIALYILYWLMLVFNDKLNFKNTVNNPMQKHYDQCAVILNVILLSVSFLILGIRDFKWMIILSLIFSIASLVIYIIMFKYNKKICHIILYVFIGASLSLLTVFQFIFIGHSFDTIARLIGTLCVDLIYVLFEVIRYLRIKKAKAQ